jgi:hypothetical protein
VFGLLLAGCAALLTGFLYFDNRLGYSRSLSRSGTYMPAPGWRRHLIDVIHAPYAHAGKGMGPPAMPAQVSQELERLPRADPGLLDRITDRAAPRIRPGLDPALRRGAALVLAGRRLEAWRALWSVVRTRPADGKAWYLLFVLASRERGLETFCVEAMRRAARDRRLFSDWLSRDTLSRDPLLAAARGSLWFEELMRPFPPLPLAGHRGRHPVLRQRR